MSRLMEAGADFRRCDRDPSLASNRAAVGRDSTRVALSHWIQRLTPERSDH
jgi:hypothetical protein